MFSTVSLINAFGSPGSIYSEIDSVLIPRQINLLFSVSVTSISNAPDHKRSLVSVPIPVLSQWPREYRPGEIPLLTCGVLMNEVYQGSVLNIVLHLVKAAQYINGLHF